MKKAAAVKVVVASTFHAAPRNTFSSAGRFSHTSLGSDQLRHATTPARRIVCARLLVDGNPFGEDRLIRALMALRRTHELEIAVFVFVVVPAREGEHPGPRLIEGGKGARILRPVFARAEQALGVGVVIRYAGAAVRGPYPELGELGDIGRALHGAAVVLVHDEHAVGDTFAVYGLLDETGGVFGVRYSNTGGWELLRSLGFTPQRPGKRDEQAIRAWKGRTRPALNKCPRSSPPSSSTPSGSKRNCLLRDEASTAYRIINNPPLTMKLPLGVSTGRSE